MARKSTKKPADNNLPDAPLATAKDPLTQSFIPETSDINRAGLIAEFNRLLKTARTLQGEANHWSRVSANQTQELSRRNDIIESQNRKHYELEREIAWQVDVIEHQEKMYEKYAGPQYSSLFIGILGGVFLGFVIASSVL